MTTKAFEEQDSYYLENLFDSIVAANNDYDAPPHNEAAMGQDASSDKIINKIGHLTRLLHNCLHELGNNEKLKRAASTLPAARDRLNYLSTIIQQTTKNVLDATEAAQPVIEKIEVDSQRLAKEWQKLLDNNFNTHHFNNLVMQTQTLLVEIPMQTKETNAHLIKIQAAQELQELSGRVINKIVDITLQMESQLMEVLVENPLSTSNSTIKTNITINQGQDQVSNVLGRLGF